MFYRCISLTEIPDISKWNTSKCNCSSMFHYCISLSLFPENSNIKEYNCCEIDYVKYDYACFNCINFLYKK